MSFKKGQQNYDGRRGCDVCEGWWISKEEAIEWAEEDWWNLPRCQELVEPLQHDANGPEDRPIWMYKNGDMYLGSWKPFGPKGVPAEHGVGLYYCHSYSSSYHCNSKQLRGRMFIGNFTDGQLGNGEMFWLETSDTWIENHLPASFLKAPGGRKGVPYCARGDFSFYRIHDDHAVITLKDGTSRTGPWKNGEPVGDWHDHPPTVAAAHAAGPEQMNGEEESLQQTAREEYKKLAAKRHSNTKSGENTSAQRPKASKKKGQPKYDGRRGAGQYGCQVMSGWWISKAEAIEQSGEDWWNLPRCRKLVEPIQHDLNGPADKPIWMYANGDMYLGNWKPLGPKGVPVEHGLGLSYCNSPSKAKGCMKIGNRTDGWLDGKGELFWLETSDVWQENHLPGSEFTLPGSRRGVPFCIKGNFSKVNHLVHDNHAVITLKDGTSRTGPWQNGKPVGNWHDHPLTVAVAHAAGPEFHVDDEEEAWQQAPSEAKKPGRVSDDEELQDGDEARKPSKKARSAKGANVLFEESLPAAIQNQKQKIHLLEPTNGKDAQQQDSNETPKPAASNAPNLRANRANCPTEESTKLSTRNSDKQRPAHIASISNERKVQDCGESRKRSAEHEPGPPKMRPSSNAPCGRLSATSKKPPKPKAPVYERLYGQLPVPKKASKPVPEATTNLGRRESGEPPRKPARIRGVLATKSAYRTPRYASSGRAMRADECLAAPATEGKERRSEVVSPHKGGNDKPEESSRVSKKKKREAKAQLEEGVDTRKPAAKKAARPKRANYQTEGSRDSPTKKQKHDNRNEADPTVHANARRKYARFHAVGYARKSTGPVASKEEPPEVIALLDSDDDSVGEEAPKECAAVKQEPVAEETSSEGRAVKQEDNGQDPAGVEEQTRRRQIAEYLTNDLFGNNPSPRTMARYARRLYEMGFESVEMIQAYLKTDHIQSFDWMTPLHMDILLQKVGKKESDEE